MRQKTNELHPKTEHSTSDLAWTLQKESISLKPTKIKRVKDVRFKLKELKRCRNK